MAAGLGFKTFNTGDVLSAADVNGYLMQGILVFADATARDAAITSPEEGQFAFLKDTNVTTYYTGSAWANVDTTGMTNPMTTTGDVIYSSSGSTPARLGIGTAGQVLQVNSGATAPEWATPAGGATGPAFRAFRSTSVQSIASTTNVKVQLNAETFDTDGCFDSTTNYRFTPTTAGYYLITANIGLINGGSGYGTAFIYKNGSRVSAGRVQIWIADAKNPQCTDIIYLNGSSDYIELYTLNNSATAEVGSGTDETWLTGAFIHA
jgi:hypothetical protein